jgi:hypothetical protein
MPNFAPIAPPGFEEPTLALKIWAWIFGPGDMENGVPKKKEPKHKDNTKDKGSNATVQAKDEGGHGKKKKVLKNTQKRNSSTTAN